MQRYYIEQEDGGRGLEISPAAMSSANMECFVHCHPQHSVGHLHVHCCLRNLWTKNGQKLAYKNMPLTAVIEGLTSKLEKAPTASES